MKYKNKTNDKPNNYKVVFLGNSAAGKSSIIHHCINGNFSHIGGSTIGAIFFTATYGKEIITEKKDSNIKLHIWDTSGQSMFRSVVSLYYRNADVCLIVCDLCDDHSMEAVDEWMNEFKTKTNNPNAKIIILGNKLDLITTDFRKKILNDLNKIGEKHQCPVLAISALDGTNITRVFSMIYDLVEGTEPCEKQEKLKLEMEQKQNEEQNHRRWWCNLL